jgi:hypothetical protein
MMLPRFLLTCTTSWKLLKHCTFERPCHTTRRDIGQSMCSATGTGIKIPIFVHIYIICIIQLCILSLNALTELMIESPASSCDKQEKCIASLRPSQNTSTALSAALRARSYMWHRGKKAKIIAQFIAGVHFISVGHLPLPFLLGNSPSSQLPQFNFMFKYD